MRHIIQKIIFALLALTLILLTSGASDTITINNTPDPNPIKPPESTSTNYLVAVGQYEVGFNIASPGFFENGYRTTYNSDSLFEDYNFYSTSIVDDNDGSCIFIEVREFKYPVSKNAQNLESNIINDYAQFVPHTQSGIMNGNGLNVVDYGSPPGYHGYHGIIIDWPSDKTEIVMQGYLTSREIWRDIRGSINLSEKPKK